MPAVAATLEYFWGSIFGAVLDIIILIKIIVTIFLESELSVTVIDVKMELENSVQILDEQICILLCVDAFGKLINPYIPHKYLINSWSDYIIWPWLGKQSRRRIIFFF